MIATFWQKGNTIEFTNESTKTIPANTVIPLASRIVVAGSDIEPNAERSVITSGVFILTKTDASTKINQGEKVYFDGTGIVNEASENIPAGWAIKTSDAGNSDVYVKIG